MRPDTALHIESLNKQFGGLKAISEFNLTVQEGERRLLLGPNGAGKTTLFNLISGDLRPSSGRVRMFGQEITGWSPHGCAHAGMARTYQILTLFQNNTLVDNVRLALIGTQPIRWNPFADVTAKSDLEDSAADIVERVGLRDKRNHPVGSCAYGEKRRLEVALALAQNPKLLLLDEPLAGLSTLERSEMQALVEQITTDITIVFIEHDMDVALRLASSVTVMHRGTVIFEGNRDEVVASKDVQEVYLAG